MSERQKILIVDDRRENLWALAATLRDAEADIVQASSGNAALIACLNHDFALAILDVQMPEMDGLEATRIIRDPQTSVLNPKIPIIAMTALAMLGDREHCLQTGMNDYVTKPISPPALIEALNTWLPAAHRMPSISAGRNDVGRPASLEVPVYDHAKVQSRLMDDEELVSGVLDQFLTSMPEQLELLRQAVETEDAKHAELTAHAIKGAAANVDGERLRCVAREMEQTVHVRDWNVAKGQLAELQLQIERLRDAIQTHRRQ